MLATFKNLFTAFTLTLLVAQSVNGIESSTTQTGSVSTKKYTLLYFTADWCGPCQLMQRETWPSSQVRKALEALNFKVIDVDESQELAQKWSVRSMPSFIITDASEKTVLGRTVGFMDADRMASWLAETTLTAEETLAAKRKADAAYAANLAKLNALFSTQYTQETEQALMALYSILSVREPMSDEQNATFNRILQRLSEEYPKRLATGLLHNDLQVRVQVSRTLAGQGNRLDAWADRSEREEQVAAFLAAKDE